MGRAYSMDLRERVVAAVAQEGLSRRQAAARFGVSDSTAINWLKRVATKGSVAPGQIGGHKPRKIAGAHRDWLCQESCVRGHSEAAGGRAMAIKKGTLDELLSGRDPKQVFSKDGLFDELKKALAERVLNAELDEHLDGEAAAGKANH